MQSDKMHKNKYSNNTKKYSNNTKKICAYEKMCIKNMHTNHQILIHLSVSFLETVGNSRYY